MAATPRVFSAFSFSSAIRGHHVYKSMWPPFVGEHLEIERENSNAHHRFAIAVIKVCPTRITPTIIGHFPREISNIIWHFLSCGREGKCVPVVAERRRHSSLVQGGLEVPCSVRLPGKKKLVYTSETLVRNCQQ